MYYVIGETLIPCSMEDALNGNRKYVAVVTPGEWEHYREEFQIQTELPIEIDEISETKLDVNLDALTGTFSIPQRDKIGERYFEFSFVMNEKGIVFIDRMLDMDHYLEEIMKTRKWKNPSMDRFLYDFLESTVAGDLKLLNHFEGDLTEMENSILDRNNDTDILRSINRIRGQLLNLRAHYEELMDVTQELEENENQFFTEENLRYFSLFEVRLERLMNNVSYLRELTVQLRDLYQTQLEVKQNNNMALLTILTTIFFPMSIITGWYGMNFIHMPELEFRFAYPVLILICIGIVTTEIIWFKKKKIW